MYETYPKGKPVPGGYIGDGETGQKKFTPTKVGGMDADPGHPSGKTRYPKGKPVNKEMHDCKPGTPKSVRAGGMTKVELYPKKRRTLRSEEHVGTDKFSASTSKKTAPDKR